MPDIAAHAALRLAVLVSGRGSNLKALIDAQAQAGANFEICLVASDKAEAPALRMAEASGIPTCALDPAGYANRADFDQALFARIRDSGANLVVLAGFMRVIDADSVTPWHGRMINIHPSLLPKYRGLHTHRRALRAGDKLHGASVHFVTAELDGGPVIAQSTITITKSDDELSLAARLLPEEHRLLIAVTQALAAQRLRLVNDEVHFDGKPIAAPLQLHADGLGSASSTHTAAE